MAYCWFCHWGWPKQVRDIYDRHVAIAGDSAMLFGPAHVVWEDENFERASVQSCLDAFDKYRREDHSDEQHEAVRRSLHELLALSDDVLYPVPPAYETDDMRPEAHPPRADLVMVPRPRYA